LSTGDVKKLLRAIDAHAELLQDQPGPNSDDEWLKQMIQVGVSTGLRRSALCRLRWADVDLNHQLLTVRNRGEEKTKSGHERSVPLRGDAFDLLARMKREQEGGGLNARVFSDSEGRAIRPDRASHRFKFFARKAKLKDRERLSFHSLRHTTASWLAMQGVPMRVIQGILGHSTVNMTERYSHLAPEVMEKAMEETFGV
jgi:integrase